MRGLGSRVWGLSSRVGIAIQDAGFNAWGLGLALRMRDVGLRGEP